MINIENRLHPVNYEVFKTYIKEKKISLAHLSRELGISSESLRGMLKRGYIKESYVLKISRYFKDKPYVLGIDFDSTEYVYLNINQLEGSINTLDRLRTDVWRKYLDIDKDIREMKTELEYLRRQINI